MKLVLIPLAILLAAGILYLIKLRAVVQKHAPGTSSGRVLVLVKDQELWLEGFIRKFFRCLQTPMELLVVDDGSRDGTPEVLSRLQKVYAFECYSSREVGDRSDLAGTARFDVRGLRGKELLRSPIFSHLSRVNAGKSHVLSK